MRRTMIPIAVGGAVLAVAAPALAHITVQPPEAVVASFSRFVVQVPNERDDANTIRVQVQLPPLAFVSFQDTPGWDRTVEMETPDEPLEVFGEQITEVVGTVTWEGGEIQPGEFEEFEFSARMPEGTTQLEFPAIQTYDSGEVVRWIGPPDSEQPAPLVQVLDIGAAEAEGELAVLARLTRQEAQASEDGNPNGGLGTIAAWIALGLSVVAVIISLTRRRAS
jgi:uncharacterized protein YcnI